MLKIGEFSRISQVPVKTLRYYDDIGLLHPAHIDKFTKYRYYTVEQITTLNQIFVLKDCGLSLEEITDLLKTNPSPIEIERLLQQKQAELRKHIEEELARLMRIEMRLKHMKNEGVMSAVTIKKVEPVNVVSVREVLPGVGAMGQQFGEVMETMQRHQLKQTGVSMGIYHDEEFNPERVDLEIAVPSEAVGSFPMNHSREMRARELPGVETMASILHQGRLDSLALTYQTLGEWVHQQGYRLAGPTRELYLQSSTPDSDGWLIEIQMPVK